MKYLWIGVSNSKEGREEVLSNGGKLLSAEVSNDALVAGLEKSGIFCDSINSGRIPTFPEYPLRRIRPYCWQVSEDCNGINVGYINYPYVNLLSKKHSMKNEARKWAKTHKDEQVTVFVYQMHTPFMAAADVVKKIIPSAKIVLIVPDLPQYMDMKMSRLKKILKQIDWKIICRYMRRVDKYVLYSKHMADFLGLNEDVWMTMEGSYDQSLLIEANRSKDNHTISVMYSGVLDLRYGIKELLDSMKLLDENYELWLTGDGNAVPLIEERAKDDPRIKYYGFLPSRLDLLRMQHNATMLISTRDPNEIASKYCFPSKIFEYMVSGNPVLSTRIQGIPDEYFKYMVELVDITPETLSEKIRETAEMGEKQRSEFGNAAKMFILENKNNVAQMKRVLEFID